MKSIEEKILKDGKVINNEYLKVDNFVNHQIDPKTIREFAREVKKEFANFQIDKILTIEASGIAVGYAVAEEFGDLPCVFAKKSPTNIQIDENYTELVKSFTREQYFNVSVAKEYIKPGENILIVDDFLAEGSAASGLADICIQGCANVVGIASMIEKVFQGGRQRLEANGYKVFAGASIIAFENNKPVFKKD